MKFDSAGRVEDVVWNMRLADLPRGDDRAILDDLYNGFPPFDQNKAEENNIEVNVNDLSGPNLLAQARRQWNNAFLKPGNYFNVALDSGTPHKRQEWSHTITREANRVLKRSRQMMEKHRATGATVMLHGMGPANWKDCKSPIPVPLSPASLLIPSDTDLDFENLEYFAVFREWTPAMLHDLTHGPRPDPGWDMGIVNSQLKYAAEQYQKNTNSSAYQYMPEKIAELIKQDKGMWGSDAVPTVDAWDFYFREAEDGKGWYRRCILDWGLTEAELKASSKPDQKNDGNFIYSSGKRKYADNLSEMLCCQFADCSAVAPFKYHSVRSLGWLLWGVCDLQNRLHCKFTEAVFEQLMWFFRTAGNADLMRIKKANFFHMGVIPDGVRFVTADERFKPDTNIVSMAFARNRQLMSESSASFTQDFDKGNSSKEMTATETMARVNSVNALVSSMLSLAYDYEEYEYREICRRLAMKGNSHPMASKFRLACLKGGVPAEMLDVDRWDISCERVLGAGNKTLEMAQSQILQGIRKNLGPDAQRRVDHITIEAATDDPDLAEDLAPLQGQKVISHSMHDAQLSTERLMRGLPFTQTPEMVVEDYVIVWLHDMATIVQQVQAGGGVGDAATIQGLNNVAQHVAAFLQLMAENPDDAERVKEYQNALSQLVNHIKAFAQRLQQQQAKRNGGNGLDPESAAKLRGKMLMDDVKARNMEKSHAIRTAQKQAQFEIGIQNEDKKTAAEIRREDARTAQELMHNRLRTFQGE